MGKFCVGYLVIFASVFFAWNGFSMQEDQETLLDPDFLSDDAILKVYGSKNNTWMVVSFPKSEEQKERSRFFMGSKQGGVWVFLELPIFHDCTSPSGNSVELSIAACSSSNLLSKYTVYQGNGRNESNTLKICQNRMIATFPSFLDSQTIKDKIRSKKIKSYPLGRELAHLFQVDDGKELLAIDHLRAQPGSSAIVRFKDGDLIEELAADCSKDGFSYRSRDGSLLVQAVQNLLKTASPREDSSQVLLPISLQDVSEELRQLLEKSGRYPLIAATKAPF